MKKLFSLLKQFQLPFFQFTSSRYEDYQKINATPYNQFFWKNINEFGMTSVKNANTNFAENQANLTNETLFTSDNSLKNGLFEKPYVFWSSNRISFKETSPQETTYQTNLGGIPSEQYHLSAQIYCDINFLNDSLNVITSTVFDPFQSFYHLDLDTFGMAFINMYFDLVEIHRMEYMKSINNNTNKADATRLFKQTQDRLNEAQNRFFKDVQHGTNAQGMKDWNAYIFKKLKIDNLEFFGVYQP